MERISAILPPGHGDLAVHRGARRASQRWPWHADVELVEPAGGTGTTLNASAGGLRIAVDRELPVGEHVVAKVKTAHRETVEHMRVVWARELPDGWLCGLAFVDPS